MNDVTGIDVTAASAGAPVSELAVHVPTAQPEESVASVRARLFGARHGTVTHTVLTDNLGCFSGLVRATDLMAADGDAPINSVVMSDPPVVAATESREQAIWEVVRRGESEIVVIDDDGKLVGMVPAPSVLAAVVREHDDDIARLGGYLHQGDSARRASSENVAHRLVHRLPWLLVGLVGSFGAAWLISGFEHHLATVLSLAFFVPAIVYLADAVGHQTSTIALRGLSVGVPLRQTFFKDAASGAILGVALGLMFVVPAWLLAHDWNVAVAVAAALTCACSVANLVALAIPWVLTRTNLDPAFGAGPLATVIQDIVSILIYFTVATILVPGL